MKLTLTTLLAALALLLAPWPATLRAQTVAPTVEADDADDEDADDEEDPHGEGAETEAQLDERINPLIDVSGADDIDIPVPDFIRSAANHINFNGADWSGLRRAFAASGQRPVSIVHIGDSHVQADMATSVTRELLQYDFGNAGRGIVMPLRLSGTNQPGDYIFSAPGTWSAVKLMGRRWDRPMGFTGTSVHPAKNETSVTIGTNDTDDYNPFSSLTLFHGGKMKIVAVNDANTDRPLKYRAIPSRDYTQILLSEPATRVTVYFTSSGDLTLYGASLASLTPGVTYHAIGNNGAAYATYNRIGAVGEGIRPLEPQLIILSLGTNEAFGRFDAATFRASVDRLVKNLRQQNPDAQLLIVTPMECQKSVNKTVSKRVKTKGRKGRKGGKSRYTTKKSSVKSYAVNPNVALVRDELLRYGRDNHIAVLDWYDVAGGKGASDTWIKAGLFSKDRVHHTGRGYRLQGRLIYDALIDALGRRN